MIPTTESVTTLAKRWAAGDRRAGSELVARHDGWIRAYARRKAMPWEDVDDVTQTMRLGFLAAAIDMGDGGDREARAFLRRHMRWIVRDVRRKNSRDPRFVDIIARMRAEDESELEFELDIFGASKPSQDDARDARKLISASNLSENELAVVMARCVEEMHQSEAAEELSCDRATVQRRLDSAMSKIRAVAGCAAQAVGFSLPTGLSGYAETDQRVMSFIRRSGTADGNQICDALGLQRQSYLLSIKRLTSAGKIVKSGSCYKRTYAVATSAEASA